MLMKKNILFILPGFNFGGTVFSTLNMISFLNRDYNISVLPMTYQGPVIRNYREAEINILPESIALSAMMGRISRETSFCRKACFLFYKVMRRLFGIIGVDYELFLFKREAKQIEKKYQFDYVASCQEGGSTYFAACFQKSKRLAWFRSEYSIYRTEYSQSFLNKDKIIYPLFDKIVCVSKTTRDDFINYFPGIAEKVVAVHNIQNCDSIFAKSNECIRDFPSSPCVIVSVGRMSPQKRFSFIPSIARKILDSGCDFKWVIIGDGNAYGEWDKLQEEIERNDVRGTVLCLGGKLNPYPYIRKANLLVNTSYVEACPRVVIEAKMLKTPVVCTDFSSAREFVTSDLDGYVETIENIHRPIITMMKNQAVYRKIKEVCDSYVIDNDSMYEQLKQILS